MTDEQLIAASKAGDESAFGQLIRRYESQVAATVYGMLGHCAEAEDVGQDVFIRFYKNLDQFQGKSKLGTYLTKIAMNLSLNELKRRKRKRMLFWEKSVEENHTLVDTDNPGGFDDQKELVNAAVQKLEPDFRSVIVLRLIDGYSTRETAQILAVPEGTVLSRLARAQKKLKKILEPHFGEYYEIQRTRSAASVA